MSATVDDVVAYTGGRLGDDDETQRLLDAALMACRSYCGWHVTPLLTDVELTVDGPGGDMLSLPTLQLVKLSECSEDGVPFDVATDLRFSVLGLVTKLSRKRWTRRYSGITVKIDHGYDLAPDFDQAVLETVDRMSLLAGTGIGASGPMVYKRVDTVHYQWAPTGGTLLNTELLNAYRLLWLA